MLNGNLDDIFEEGYESADDRPSDERMRSASAINYQTYLQIVPTDVDDDEEDIFYWDEPALSSSDSTPVYGDTPTDPAKEFPGDPNYQDPYVVQDEEEREKIRLELAQTEEDITALRSTLRAKEQAAKELKRKLGITTMSEVKKDVAQGWKNIQQSNAYNKTKSGLSTAGQKTGAAFSTLGSSISKKLGEMKDSSAFKSFETKVSTASGNIKNKITGSKSEDLSTFEETLSTTVQEEQVNADASTTKTDDNTILPEEKVGLPL